MFSNYREILGLPGALNFSLAGLAARLPISLLGLGIVLFIQGETGSYGMAGFVMATYMVAQAVSNPIIAKQIDRRGQSVVMKPLVLVHVTALALLVATVLAGWWFGLAFVFGALAGLSLGSIGSLIRARWTYIARTPRQLDSAFSWEAAIDEVIFITGPVLVTVLATSLFPPAGIILSGLATLIGSFLLYRNTDTEPEPQPKEVDRTLKGKVLSNPGILIAVFSHFMLGAGFGAIDVTVVAFSEELGQKPFSGVVLGTFAFGSLLSGLFFGTVDWKIPTHKRQALATAVFAVACCALLLPGSMLVMGITVFFVGLAIAPVAITTSTTVRELAPPKRLTEAFAWMSTSMAFGTSFGSAIAGNLIDHFGARPAFLMPVVCMALGALVVVSCVKLLDPLRSGHAARLARRATVG